MNEINKICVYAISKNEEKFAHRWYESMKEADAVVVLDTGSTDNTASVLRSLGATVEVKEIKPWRFDVARNESLKLVPEDCNILVCTDLDEVLEPGWAEKLRQAWKPGVQRGEYMYAWSHSKSGEEYRVFKYNKVHSRDWIWVYPVHEALWNKNTKTIDYSQEDAIWLSGIKLHHYPDQEKSRSSYLGLLELRELENPDDLTTKVYLACEYSYHNLYDKAIEKINEILEKYSDSCTGIYLASNYLLAGDCYVEKGELLKALENYKKAIETDITYREGYIGAASVYLKLKQYETAIIYLKQGLRNSYRHYSWLERNTSWSWEPYDLLSICHFYIGKKVEALGYAIKALSFDPEDEHLKSNLKLCLDNTSDAEYLQ